MDNWLAEPQEDIGEGNYQVSIRGVRHSLARTAGPLAERANALLPAPEGRRDWPRLFWVEARRGWIDRSRPAAADCPRG